MLQKKKFLPPLLKSQLKLWHWLRSDILRVNLPAKIFDCTETQFHYELRHFESLPFFLTFVYFSGTEKLLKQKMTRGDKELELWLMHELLFLWV